MKETTRIDIAVGFSAGAKNWRNTSTTWQAFADKLRETITTRETLREFLAAPKAEQSKIKDVGGYVGGYLNGGKRSPSSVAHRQVVTLDVDFAHLDFWEDFKMLYNVAAVIHGTHKHSEADPRYRLILLLDREVSADEYAAISRKLAGSLGIDLFDNTTFETNRLMFWPSTPTGEKYYFEQQQGPALSADDVLASYVDWKDSTQWPTASTLHAHTAAAVGHQEDPTTKKGIIGTFCRAYTIEEAIEALLADEYVAAIEGRYTYTKGSTAGGLVVYNGLFAYSHHGTDPAGSKLCNAFDLVRLHKFGHFDTDASSDKGGKSFTMMSEYALKDKRVKRLHATETLEASRYEFAEGVDEEPETVEEAVEWVTTLETDTKGNYVSSAANITRILTHDERLKGAFKYNEFDAKRYVCKSLPWRLVKTPEPMKNVDFAGVRNYVESIYGISSPMKIDDALTLEVDRQTFNPVREYLRATKWDGVPRIASLLCEYFGAESGEYTAESMRVMLVGAVARVMRPGCKFDLVLTLVGEQGTKKSTFLKILGGLWFSDTFMSVHGKDALEQIQGAWIIEIAELAGLRKAEIEAVKHFITKQEDQFRPAYARTSETFKRQCVFFATTNNREFLRDPSGNRRFLPIDVRPEHVKKDVFEDLAGEVSQIWAEAFKLYSEGSPTHLSTEAESLAEIEQRAHSEIDERQGLIEAYLAKPVPANWDTLSVFDRAAISDSANTPEGAPRSVVCVAEIWAECLGKEKKDMSRYNTRELNDIMRGLEGWTASPSTKHFINYGKQKYYTRKK
jgi:putative DNA primase/helicase